MDPKAPTSVLERREKILAPLDRGNFSTLIRLASDGRHRLVVSFGGGSIPGLCGNIALTQIIEELDLKRHVAEIWGTSAGAAVGGPWASGTPSPGILAAMQSLDRKGSVDLSWLRLAGALLLKPFGGRLPDGLIGARHFIDAIEGAMSVRTFEECPIPFRCIACTDDGESRRKVFRRGPVLPAIFSSMSLPGIVIPRKPIEGETCGYYDGGLVEKTPLLSPIAEHNQKGDGRKLLLLGTHYGNDARRTPAKGFINRFLQSIYALESLVWEHQLAEARSRPNVVLMMLNPHIDDPKLFDFSRIERNLLHAREAFADILQNARLPLSFGLR